VSQTTDTPLQIDQTSTETTQNGMSRCLEWDDESFDLVYGHFNLSAAKTPQHSLSELIRVSKPNAKIIVADHDGQDLNHYPLAPYLEKNLIELLQEASRLICGQLNSALQAKGSIQLSFDLDSFRSEFFAFFQNPTRFSYSSVILVEGIKDG